MALGEGPGQAAARRPGRCGARRRPRCSACGTRQRPGLMSCCQPAAVNGATRPCPAPPPPRGSCPEPSGPTPGGRRPLPAPRRVRAPRTKAGRSTLIGAPAVTGGLIGPRAAAAPAQALQILLNTTLGGRGAAGGALGRRQKWLETAPFWLRRLAAACRPAASPPRPALGAARPRPNQSPISSATFLQPAHLF